jgi:hypothetical protein
LVVSVAFASPHMKSFVGMETLNSLALMAMFDSEKP